MLHTLMTSPFRCDISSMLNLLNIGDDILLIQDGVIAALNTPTFKAIVNTSISLYVLQEDLDARGLSHHISNKFTIVNYTGFVRLVVKNSQQILW